MIASKQAISLIQSGNDSILSRASICKISKDGNCFFRGISKALYLNEDYYPTIKRQASLYVQNNPIFFLDLESSEVNEISIILLKEGEYADDRVIAVIPYVINASIVIVSNLYTKPIQYPENLEIYKNAIFLYHQINPEHFDLLSFNHEKVANIQNLEPKNIDTGENSQAITYIKFSGTYLQLKFQLFNIELHDTIYPSINHKKRTNYYNEVFNFLMNAKLPERFNSGEYTQTTITNWKNHADRNFKLWRSTIYSHSELFCNHNNSYYQIPLSGEIHDLLEFIHRLDQQHLKLNNMKNVLDEIKIYWTSFEDHITLFLKNCPVCKSNPVFLKPCKQYIPIESSKPLERIVIDLLSMKIEKKITFIFNAIDHFTRKAWSYLIPDKSSQSTTEAMQKLFKDISPQVIEMVQTDNGREFLGYFSEYLLENNIKHVKSRPYNPQCQGSVESFNKYLQGQISTALRDSAIYKKEFNLEEVIGQILEFYNKQKLHTSTKFKPDQLFNTVNAEDNEEAKVNIRQVVEKKKSYYQDSIEINDYLLIENSFIKSKSGNIVHKTSLKAKSHVAVGIALTSQSNGYVKVQVYKSKDCDIDENKIYICDIKVLVKCEKLVFDAYLKII